MTCLGRICGSVNNAMQQWATTRVFNTAVRQYNSPLVDAFVKSGIAPGLGKMTKDPKEYRLLESIIDSLRKKDIEALTEEEFNHLLHIGPHVSTKMDSRSAISRVIDSFKGKAFAKDTVGCISGGKATVNGKPYSGWIDRYEYNDSYHDLFIDGNPILELMTRFDHGFGFGTSYDYWVHMIDAPLYKLKDRYLLYPGK